MKYLDTILITFFIIIGIYLYQGGQPEILTEKLDEMTENMTKNLMNEINYTNLYQETPTIKNSIMNIMNGYIYQLMITINTLLPITIHIAKGHIGWQLTKLAILLTSIWTIFRLITIIKAGIILGFWIKEKRKDKTKIWE